MAPDSANQRRRRYGNVGKNHPAPWAPMLPKVHGPDDSLGSCQAGPPARYGAVWRFFGRSSHLAGQERDFCGDCSHKTRPMFWLAGWTRFTRVTTRVSPPDFVLALARVAIGWPMVALI